MPARSQKRFIDAAESQGWKLESETDGNTVSLTATDPAITPPTEMKYADLKYADSTIHKIVGQFYEPDGSYLQGWVCSWRRYANEEPSESRHGRQKIGDLVGSLNHGPNLRAIQAAEKDAKDTAEAIRRDAAVEILAAAATTDEMQRFYQQYRNQRDQIESDLKQALESVINKAQEALEAVNDGKLTENWGGALFGNGHIERAENAAGRRNILMQQQRWLESMFGSLPKSWS